LFLGGFLARRFVGLGAQQIRQNIALIRRESVLVTRGVEHGVALIERHGAQILKSVLNECLPVGRERHQAAAGLAHLHLFLWRHAFQHLAARQAAIALRLRHLVQLVQLLDEPLLLRGSQPIKAGIIAQQPLLLIDSESPVLIQPVADMSRRSGARICVSGTDGWGLSAVRATILRVCGRRALAAVVLRVLLIGPLWILVRPLLILIPRLLVLVRSLLILILPLLVGVGARRILDLAGTALLRTRARTILAEPRSHGRTGTEFSSPLTVQDNRGQTEEQDRSGGQTERQDRSGGQTERQDRSGGPRRRTHSFRVPGPVHKSFSRLEANIQKNQSPLPLLERDSIWSST